MELGIPMVVALNMMDEVRKNGGSILINEMEHMLGVPVIPISAAKNEGIDELMVQNIRKLQKEWISVTQTGIKVQSIDVFMALCI